MCRQIRGVAPITLYLGVKFYAADPCRLVEEITRYQFFLQVKQDVLQGRLPVTQDLAVELAALALQCKCITLYVCAAIPKVFRFSFTTFTITACILHWARIVFEVAFKFLSPCGF